MAIRALLSLSVLLAGLLPRLARADNPIIQTIYTADPAPMVYNDRVYLFADHDEDGSTTYNMKDWWLYSSADMVNWQDHGVVMSIKTFSWAKTNAWAGQVIERGGKFYYYAPMQHNQGQMAIGVGVSDTILGPYKDALGKPLVMNNEFDPTVWIDENDQAWLLWGNPNLWYVKLNKDMVSYTGSPQKASINNLRFTEGPWISKRGATWYLTYAANGIPEDIRYATSSSITGPWNYKGIVMSNQGKSFTNHPALLDYRNQSYFFYHNGGLPGGSGYTRSICIEPFTYNSDGSIPSLKMTTTGVAQVGTLDPYVRQEAETMAYSSGLKTTTCSEGGQAVTNIGNGDYIKVKGVAFGSASPSTFTARVAASSAGGKIELHLGSQSGTQVGACAIPSTGGMSSWQSVNCTVSGATGTQDLFFKFTGSAFNWNWWQFSK